MYGSSDVDWMGYTITERNFTTRHHIIKRADCFPVSNNKIENSAILGRISHDLLNYLEENYAYMYDCWTDLFADIVNSKRITQQIIQRIMELRQTTEYLIVTDVNISKNLSDKFKSIFLLDDFMLENCTADDYTELYELMPNRVKMNRVKMKFYR